jgi:hypothetical protein
MSDIADFFIILQLNCIIDVKITAVLFALIHKSGVLINDAFRLIIPILIWIHWHKVEHAFPTNCPKLNWGSPLATDDFHTES